MSQPMQPQQISYIRRTFASPKIKSNVFDNSLKAYLGVNLSRYFKNKKPVLNSCSDHLLYVRSLLEPISSPKTTNKFVDLKQMVRHFSDMEKIFKTLFVSYEQELILIKTQDELRNKTLELILQNTKDILDIVIQHNMSVGNKYWNAVGFNVSLNFGFDSIKAKLSDKTPGRIFYGINESNTTVYLGHFDMKFDGVDLKLDSLKFLEMNPNFPTLASCRKGTDGGIEFYYIDEKTTPEVYEETQFIQNIDKDLQDRMDKLVTKPSNKTKSVAPAVAPEEEPIVAQGGKRKTKKGKENKKAKNTKTQRNQRKLLK